jgi:hypothetical protein
MNLPELKVVLMPIEGMMYVVRVSAGYFCLRQFRMPFESRYGALGKCGGRGYEF